MSVGAEESAFPIDIDASQSVRDLKDANTTKQKYDFAASKLQLDVAKKGDGWLSDDDPAALRLDEGEIHANIQAVLDGEKMKATKTLQHWLFDKSRMPQPSTDQIHVLVVVPSEDEVMPQQSVVWKKPKLLVGSTGANWDFQNSLDLGNLASAISHHYQAWKNGKTDKQSHPLFVCLNGPGTGKSRLLDEFPNVLQQEIFCDEAQKDEEMKQLLRNAYTFKVTFENGTTDNYGISDPRKMIGTRMLYQLQESDWTVFNGNPVNQVFPGEVLTKLSAITGTGSSQICVILCIDSLHKLEHEPGSKHSEFYTALALLCDLVNASKCFVIAICAATIYQPVDEFLADSPQWREMLQTTSLDRPTIKGTSVFDTFKDGNGRLTQLLVDDIGGHGRALEKLFDVMLQNQGQVFECIPVMRNVLAAIRKAYPAIVTEMHSMKQAFLAVISRRIVNQNSIFGSLTLDQAVSCGLIRRNGTHLQCLFILYMLLETHYIPWNKHATYALIERLEDLKPWQLWEQFNCKFRALKFEAFSQKEPVLWTDIDYGARMRSASY